MAETGSERISYHLIGTILRWMFQRFNKILGIWDVGEISETPLTDLIKRVAAIFYIINFTHAFKFKKYI